MAVFGAAYSITLFISHQPLMVLGVREPVLDCVGERLRAPGPGRVLR